MMEHIQGETKIDERQYGDMKGTKTEHVLLQSWERILNILENNRSLVNLISIDFSKAFNRMGHQDLPSCLRQEECLLSNTGDDFLLSTETLYASQGEPKIVQQGTDKWRNSARMRQR